MKSGDSTASVVESIVRNAKDLLAAKKRVVIAIDGRCGGGKTTLAGLLQSELNATVIHADDFFLRPEQRTEKRFAEPGGNMDRERLLAEVLLPLQSGKPFAYRPLDCQTFSLKAPIEVIPSAVTVIEGSYSCHPDLQMYYDLRIFVDVDAKEQIRRIVARNGAEKADRFVQRWIPLEEHYFTAFDIARSCHRIIRL